MHRRRVKRRGQRNDWRLSIIFDICTGDKKPTRTHADDAKEDRKGGKGGGRKDFVDVRYEDVHLL